MSLLFAAMFICAVIGLAQYHLLCHNRGHHGACYFGGLHKCHRSDVHRGSSSTPSTGPPLGRLSGLRQFLPFELVEVGHTVLRWMGRFGPQHEFNIRHIMFTDVDLNSTRR